MTKIDQFREEFLEELIKDGDLWRIFRKTTFLDLMRIEFVSYNSSHEVMHLKKVFNNAIKYLMYDHLPIVELSSNAVNTLNSLNNNYSLLVNIYDKIINKLLFEYGDAPADQFDLSNQILYLKVINQLAVDQVPNYVVTEIAWAAYRVLTFNAS